MDYESGKAIPNNQVMSKIEPDGRVAGSFVLQAREWLKWPEIEK